MLVCDVIDKLLDKNCFADARTAEKTDLTAFKIWADKVYYLDTCFKYLISGNLFFI